MNLMQKYRDLMLDVSEDNIAVTMTRGRRDTLADVMAASCDKVVAEIIDIGKWKQTDQTRNLESEILKAHKDVLAGRGKLINFQEACGRWKAEGIK